jgi:hypothetical protein
VVVLLGDAMLAHAADRPGADRLGVEPQRQTRGHAHIEILMRQQMVHAEIHVARVGERIVAVDLHHGIETVPLGGAVKAVDDVVAAATKYARAVRLDHGHERVIAPLLGGAHHDALGSEVT